ncbi:MAG: hypothetical protein RLZZ126_155 [Pseudomonadota bacterium]
MRPLTDTTPKPLLPVRGKPLLQWHIEALVSTGAEPLAINTAWLEDRLIEGVNNLKFDFFSNLNEKFPKIDNKSLLSNYDLNWVQNSLYFSQESKYFGAPLETLGGVVRALPLLDEVFWVAAGDVFVPEFDYAAQAFNTFAQGPMLAHLWLVPNPSHNPRGDFGLSPQGLALNLPLDAPQPRFTYSTIGLYRKALFMAPWCDIPLGNPQGAKAALAPLLRRAMGAGQVSAELYTGPWTDVGTPERLAALNQ